MRFLSARATKAALVTLLASPLLAQAAIPVSRASSAGTLASSGTVQDAYIKASNTNGDDDFGETLALSGNLAVVGALLEDSAATGVNGNGADNSAEDSGAAYVFARDPSTGSWSQQAYLKASNAEAGDLFGIAVAISGDTIVVGADLESSNATGVNGNETDNSATRAGAAYVFVRDSLSGTWSQQAYLKASNAEAEDAFGSAVTIAGDTIIVGAKGESSGATGVNGTQSDNGALFAGAAYVFVRDPLTGTWSQQAYLKASNTDPSDLFGGALAMAGEALVVGAIREASSATGVNGDQSDNSAPFAGAAYVFRRTGTSWAQEAYLKASNTGFNDVFGFYVAISGTTVAVGAPRESSQASGVNGNQADNSLPRAGAAYIFVQDPVSGSWGQEAYLKASNPDTSDQFGAVAISGDQLVVGALVEASKATGINGEQLDNSQNSAGAVYAFTRIPQSHCWSQRVYIKASNTRSPSLFSKSVSLSGSTLLVGSPGEWSNATGVNGNQANTQAFGAGAAYAFQLETGVSASEVVRVGAPANPNALLPGQTSGPVLGATWDPAIDHTSFFPAATMDMLLVSPGGPFNIPLGIGTLLCSPLRPRHIISGPAGVPFSLPIPADCSLLGVSACAQGASVGAGSMQLTNALDLVVGTF